MLKWRGGPKPEHVWVRDLSDAQAFQTPPFLARCGPSEGVYVTNRFEQAEFFQESTARTREELAAFLNDRPPRPVRVVVTDNRVMMLSVRFETRDGVLVRLHKAYLQAPHDIWLALRAYIHTRGRDAWRAVCDFARCITAEKPTRPRARRLRMQGQVYDLREVRDEVNQTFFGGRLKSRIGWGVPRGPRQPGRRRSIRFGAYHKEEDLVLINPRLDATDVPPEFIAYIVFHEMLHAAIPSTRRGGKWVHHSREFRAFEQRFPDWPKMQQAAKKLLG